MRSVRRGAVQMQAREDQERRERESADGGGGRSSGYGRGMSRRDVRGVVVRTVGIGGNEGPPFPYQRFYGKCLEKGAGLSDGASSAALASSDELWLLRQEDFSC